MYGYRDPGPKEESDAALRFEDQFEEDANGLTFRRFGRGRPVRVTYQERDESLAAFERLKALSIRVLVVTAIVWFVGGAWFRDDLPRWSSIAAGLVIVSAAWVVRRLLWIRCVRQFDRRVPIGPEKTVLDQYRTRAAEMSWWGAALALLLVVPVFLFADFEEPLELLKHADLSVPIAVLIVLLSLKIFDLVTKAPPGR